MDLDYNEPLKSSNESSNTSSQSRSRFPDLIDTTDCLEAIEVIKGWKNFLFALTLFALIMLQAAFWLGNSSLARSEEKTTISAQAQTDQFNPEMLQRTEPNQPADPNRPAHPVREKLALIKDIKFEYISLGIRFFNFVAAFAAILYCLTMLFGLQISIMGRLGGINHICRAFFLSFIFAVLLLPWQKAIGPTVAGIIYSSQELSQWHTNQKAADFIGHLIFYWRFSLYWLLGIFILLMAQIRSMRWAKATLKRLGVL